VYKNYGMRKSEAKKLSKHVKESFSMEGQYAKLIESMFGKIERLNNEFEIVI